MNVVLVGFMASGKSSVGRRLARRLGYQYLDTDHFIEQHSGLRISEIFSQYGEPFFRGLESKIAARLGGLENTIISTGGGMAAQPGNLAHLKRAGLVVFLKPELEDVIIRLGKDTRRPMVKNGDLRETVTKLWEERLPLYEQSDFTLGTKGKSINRVACEIISQLGWLNEQVKRRQELQDPPLSRDP